MAEPSRFSSSANPSRRAVGSYDPNTAITPVARPTDKMVQVAPVQKSPLFAVASALQQMESSLRPAVNKHWAEEKQRQAEEEKQRQLQQQKPQYAKAVRDGQIPAHASPFFSQYAKQAEGRELANSISSQVDEEYQQRDPGEDPRGFIPWITDRIQSRIQDIEDSDILSGAREGLQGLTDRLFTDNEEKVGKKVMDRAVKGVGVDITGSIDLSPTMIDDDGELQKNVGLRESIEASIENGRGIGIPEETLRKTAVDSIVDQAVERLDTSLLGSLPDDISADPYAQQRIADAQDRIVTTTYREELKASQVAGDRDRVDHDNVLTDSLLALAQRGPTAQFDEEAIKQGSKHDPRLRDRLEMIRERLSPDNPNKLADPAGDMHEEVYHRIQASDNPVAAAVHEIEAGNITSPLRLERALGTATIIQDSLKKGPDSILNHAATKQADKLIRSALTEPDVVGGPAKLYKPGYDLFNTRIRLELADWEQTNPDANEGQRQDAILDISTNIRKRIQQYMDAANYDD